MQATPHFFDWTITLGNIVSAITFIFAGVIAWRDLTWRIKNLETWRVEHMIDADARDELIRKMDHVIELLRFQIKLLMSDKGPAGPDL